MQTIENLECTIRTYYRLFLQEARRGDRYRLAWKSARRRALDMEDAIWELNEELAAERYENRGKVDFIYKMWWDSIPDNLKEEFKRRERERHPITYMRLNKETGNYERIEPPYVAEQLPLED